MGDRMTPDEEHDVDRRASTWTERHWKKASIIAGLLVVFATCTGNAMGWLGINFGDIGPAAEFRALHRADSAQKSATEALHQGQDTIARRVVGVERTMNILGAMLCTAPSRTPRDSVAQELCDEFLAELRARRRQRLEESGL